MSCPSSFFRSITRYLVVEASLMIPSEPLFPLCDNLYTVFYPVDSVILQYARLSCAFVFSFISYTTSLQQDIYGKYTCFSVDMSKPRELSDYNNLLLNCSIKST